MRASVCSTCQELNAPDTLHCTRRTNPMRAQTAYNAVPQEELNARLLTVIAVLARNGLMDEAAQQIHEAGLGPTLQDVARATR